MSVANSAEVIKTQRLFSSRSYDSSNEENDSVDSMYSGEGDSESDSDQNSDEEDCFCVASDTERCGLDDEIDSLDGDDLYVTLHRNLMLKVKARARHAYTTRLACRRSRICAY